jgi:hypothetical protein
VVITGSPGERLGGYKLPRGFESRPLRQMLLRVMIDDRARRGVSGALNLQSATAGSNAYLRLYLFKA